MRYRCVDAQKAAGFPVVAACQAVGVSAWAFYAWAAKGAQGQPAAEQTQAELVAKIRTIHAESAGTYGSPRVTHELRRRGWRVNHKRVERLMAAHGISDRGSEYTATACIDACQRLGLRRSMGRTGSCLDNAVAESFIATLKVELVDRQHYRTRAQARASIFRWIAWHNQRRLHSTND
jgi:transposase InsO family protein